jgi:endonuclease YncB( thermonuclease family)
MSEERVRLANVQVAEALANVDYYLAMIKKIEAKQDFIGNERIYVLYKKQLEKAREHHLNLYIQKNNELRDSFSEIQ